MVTELKPLRWGFLRSGECILLVRLSFFLSYTEPEGSYPSGTGMNGESLSRGLGTGVHLAYDPCQLLTVEYKVVARADENQVCSFTRPTLGLRESYACGGGVRPARAKACTGNPQRSRNARSRGREAPAL